MREEQNDDDDDEDDIETRQELQDARKRAKLSNNNNNNNNNSNKSQASTHKRDADKNNSNTSSVMHHFKADPSNRGISAADLATSTVQHHPLAISGTSTTTTTTTTTEGSAAGGPAKQKRNPFLAGPIKAPTNIRTTCRFDYQPDICKDYKDTGFCGFGDTCIYLHDRGDSMSGWQLEQQWEEQQKELKKKQQEDQMNAFAATGNSTTGTSNSNTKESGAGGDLLVEDGLPFACFLCRQAFTDPVVTNCQHYFCERCILTNVKEQSEKCPICSKDTHRVFHQPTKLLSKRRRVVGAKGTWLEYYDKLRPKDDDETERRLID
jgi:RING finger protein 113A